MHLLQPLYHFAAGLETLLRLCVVLAHTLSRSDNANSDHCAPLLALLWMGRGESQSKVRSEGGSLVACVAGWLWSGRSGM